jgi:hypothetical protein
MDTLDGSATPIATAAVTMHRITTLEAITLLGRHDVMASRWLE